MPWNPNRPDTLGFEFAPQRVDQATVGSEGAGLAVAFTAEATRTLAAGGLGAGLQVATPGDWTMELYTEAGFNAARSDTVGHAGYAPTADRHWYGVWTFPTDVGAGNWWSQVGGTPGTAPNANWLVVGGPSHPVSGSGFYAARFAGLAIPAGSRFLALRLLNDRVLSNWTPNGPDPNNVSGLESPFADSTPARQHRISGEERISGANARQTVTYTFRPRLVLTAADHAATLAADWAGDGSGFGFFLTSYCGTGFQMESYHLQLVADYVTERRLAWGTGVRFGSGDASGVLQAAPLGDRWTEWVAPGAAPTITAGERYVLVIRGPKFADRSPFVGRLPMLTPGPPISGYSAGRIRFDANGLPTQAVPTDRIGVPLYTGTPTPGPLYPPTSGPSVDSMAYPKQGVQPVLDITVSQRISVPAGSAPIGQLVLPIARPDYEGASPLVVRLVNEASGLPQGGAFILTTEAWDALPAGYVLGGRAIKNVRVTLLHDQVLTSGGWWVEMSTADVHPLTEATPWGVLYLEAFTVNAWPGPPNNFQPGSPELLPWEGGRQSSILLVSSPVAPTDFAVTQRPAQLVPATEACSGLWDTSVLTWTATTLPAGKFYRYEVERLDVPEADGGTWERIANIEDEAATTIRDYEARRGVTVRYRLRVMRLDGGTSAWVEAPAITTDARCCGIGLVSNDPAVRSLFYTDVDELRTFANLDADSVVIRPLYGGNYQQAFHARERRGVRFETQLLVAHGSNTKGLPTFNNLRELARSDQPIGVFTERGDRLYAALVVAELTYSPNRQMQRYYATFQATEITDQAPTIEIGPPPPPLAIAGTFHMGPHPNDKLDSDFFMGFGR